LVGKISIDELSRSLTQKARQFRRSPAETGRTCHDWDAEGYDSVIKIKPTIINYLGFFLILIISGAMSVHFGRRAGFDVMKYHEYNAFAFLNNRQNFDVLAAGPLTYSNPLLDLPFYFCTTRLSPRACGFAAGFVHGLNYVGAVVVAALVLAEPKNGPPLSRPLPWALAAAGALGAVSLGTLGAGNNDNIVSLFFLVSLFLICREAEYVGSSLRRSLTWVVAAGIIVGMGCGLKLTLVPFGLAIGFAPVVYPIRWLYRFLFVACCGIGIAVGTLVTSGFQMVRTFRTFGDPVFPFFSAWFDSPYRDFLNTRDVRFLPANILEALFYPLIFVFDPYRTSEFPYRDFRIQALFVLALICALALVIRYIATPAGSSWVRQPAAIPPRVRAFLAVLLMAYVLWMVQFSVYRYLFPVELLSFVAMALMLRYLFIGKAQFVALALLAAVIIPTTKPFADRGLLWDGKDYISVQLPDSPRPRDGAIVLLVGTSAMTYVIPAFPPGVRFLGVDVLDRFQRATGEFNGSLPASEADLGLLGAHMRELIKAHDGQVLGMFNPGSRDRAIAAFARYDLRFDPARCGQMISNVAAENPVQLCELSRS
jgi:hypothetical protein